MGLFSSIGSIGSSIVHAAVNTVAAPVNFVQNVASGKNVAESAGNLGVKLAAGATAPGDIIAQKSGLNTLISKVPLVGGPLSTFSNAGADIALNSANVSRGTALNYGRSGAEIGAIAAGGYFAAPYVGAYGSALMSQGVDLTATSELVGGSLLGAKVVSGLAAGRAPSLSDIAAGNQFLGDPTGIGDIFPTDTAGNPVGIGIPPRGFTGPLRPTGLMTPPSIPLGNEMPGPVFFALLGLGSYLAIHAIRKGHLG